MATIKSHTSLEQSRKLAKILPHESADFGWNVFVDGTSRILPINDWDLVKDGNGNVKFYHAWSLAALISVLPNGIIMHKDSQNGKYHCCSTYAGTYIKADNPVDACVEMIIKLHEQNLL